MKGIDVSYCQNVINWDAVKADGIEFAIIRAGYGRSVSQTDARFVQHYNGAMIVGMPVGAYWYSYAESVEDARSEAKACIEVLGDRKFSLPIYYDVEEPSILGKGKDFVSECITVFCTELEKAGYFTGVYTSKSVLENLVHKEVAERFAVWSAQWNTTDDYKGQHGMWQYSDKGRVKGINGDVDMDEMYVDYPSIIIPGGYNNYPEKPDSSGSDDQDGIDDADGADELEIRLRNIERRLDALEQGRK